MTLGNKGKFDGDDSEEMMKDFKLYTEVISPSNEAIVKPESSDDEKEWWTPYENKITVKKFSG